MTTLAILADDLTGAGDAAGAFASHGFATAIMFGETVGGEYGVVVRSTDTRDVDATTAADTNRRIARLMRYGGSSPRPVLLYKKIDSALRGHPRDELVAVMRALGETKTLVAPALPGQARTTVDSRQLIAGEPIERTGLGTAAGTSDLRAVFAGCEDVPVWPISLATVRAGGQAVASVIAETERGILIADAETDRDLETIARGCVESGLRVMAGSAGLGRALASVLPPSRSTARPSHPPPLGPVLVVAASQHAATSAQVGVLEEADVPVVRPGQDLLDGVDLSNDAVVNALGRCVSAGRSAVLTTAGCAPSAAGTIHVADTLADVVARVARQHPVGSLVLTGGHVAAAVLERLDATAIELGGEVQPAVPWGTLYATRVPPLRIITKAGSFGEPNALLRCLERLQQEAVSDTWSRPSST
ncbi:MAG TPA: four-carbon acid sugar kinase family protein [Thermomicrobiales bacterium]|nr:four-carbon acid sugar kinase family protein [Thermomicrobiales bacterium]